MRKFATKIILFFTIVALVDFCFGQIFGHLPRYAKGGDTRRMFTIADSIDDQVLVMGSSRAIHHYIPRMMEDSLNCSVYNCGLDGNGIIFNYGQFQLIADRYKPHTIIYDIAPGFDLLDDPSAPNERFLGRLRPFYGRSGIAEIFSSVSPFEKYKMLSSMYRYNKIFIQMASDVVSPMNQSDKGFKPMVGVMDYEIERKTSPKLPIDSLKIEYLQRFATQCKESDIELVFVMSPIYRNQDNYDLSAINSICDQYGFKFWQYQNDSTFCNNKNYFKDSYHLNLEGAQAYTEEIIRRLKSESPQQ